MDPEGSERHRSLAMRCGWCVRLKMPGTGLHEALVRDRESCVEKRSVRSQDERKCRLPEGERETSGQENRRIPSSHSASCLALRILCSESERSEAAGLIVSLTLLISHGGR